MDNLKKPTTHYSWKVCKYQGVIRSCKSKRNTIKWSFLYSTRMLSHDDHWVSLQFQCRWVYRLIVFNTTFNNILAISWCRKSEYFKLHQNGFQLWRTLTRWKVLENKHIDLKRPPLPHIYLYETKVYIICIPILYHEKWKRTLWKVFHKKIILLYVKITTK